VLCMVAAATVNCLTHPMPEAIVCEKGDSLLKYMFEIIDFMIMFCCRFIYDKFL
jgi:hypothetical protein